MAHCPWYNHIIFFHSLGYWQDCQYKAGYISPTGHLICPELRVECTVHTASIGSEITSIFWHTCTAAEYAVHAMCMCIFNFVRFCDHHSSTKRCPTHLCPSLIWSHPVLKSCSTYTELFAHLKLYISVCVLYKNQGNTPKWVLNLWCIDAGMHAWCWLVCGFDANVTVLFFPYSLDFIL